MRIKGNRVDITVPYGTTVRRAIRLGYTDDEGVKHYFTPDDVSTVVMAVRQDSDHYGVIAESVGEYSDDDGRWYFVFDADETETWSPHRAYYYIINSIISGDVNREQEGKLRVTPMGGVTTR